MGILGVIGSKQKRFCVGGREVLCIDADLPSGQAPAALHFLSVVERLCQYVEREQLPAAAEALAAAVGEGQGHRFKKWNYRIALGETSVGKRRCLTLSTTLTFFNTRTGERIERSHSLETLWDAQGLLQLSTKKRKREKGQKTAGKNAV